MWRESKRRKTNRFPYFPHNVQKLFSVYKRGFELARNEMDSREKTSLTLGFSPSLEVCNCC